MRLVELERVVPLPNMVTVDVSEVTVDDVSKFEWVKLTDEETIL